MRVDRNATLCGKNQDCYLNTALVRFQEYRITDQHRAPYNSPPDNEGWGRFRVPAPRAPGGTRVAGAHLAECNKACSRSAVRCGWSAVRLAFDGPLAPRN